MAQQFGNTWWGKEWLRSLTHIDYANRIPRGARYARNGSVKEIKLQGNVILAKVSGSRPRPYSVRIVVPPFTSGQVEKLIDKLISKPGIISGLLNRELDPEILAVAQSCGLEIFPGRWDDLEMNCSCPDWAVPCKHLAAVVYMLSREIDNNPFIVFRMHGLDLLEELGKRGISADAMQQEIEVPSLEDVVKPAATAEPDTPTFRRIDFSRLADCSETLLMLLPDKTNFAPQGNFKGSYAAELQRIKKPVQKFFLGKSGTEDFFHADCPVHEKRIGMDDEINLRFNYTFDWTIKSRAGYDGCALVRALLDINPDFLPDYHPSVAAMNQTLLGALHLLEKGAVFPRLFRLKDNTYMICWMPAYIDPAVKELMDSLDGLVPASLVKVQHTARSSGKPVEHPAEWLVSFFLGTLIKNLSDSPARTPLLSFFFKGQRMPFNDAGEREIPGGIKSWTASCTLTEYDYRPVFNIEEDRRGGFNLNLGVEYRTDPGKGNVPLRTVLESSDYTGERLRILRSFTLISGLVKEITGYINTGAGEPVHFTSASFAPFLLQIIPAVRMLGIKVFMPKALEHLIRPKASLSIRRKTGRDKGFLSMADLFAFDWEVALGDELVSREEFMQLQKQAGGLIKFKQHYIYTDAETLLKLHTAFSQGERLSPARILQAALSGEYESAPVRLSGEVREMIDTLTRQEHIPLPSGLEARLRPYQERGFSWMYRNSRIGFGSILADDMGLGKTLQAITLMLKMKEEGALEQGRILVVVPTGLLTNWQAEISRFAPSLAVFVYHGPGRDLKKFDADILLTTYGVLRSDNAKLKRLPWTLMFIDEAQNIKNQDTAQSKAVRGIPATTHIALSGTPVENRLSEFWSIMDYANKGFLDTPKAFREKFVNPIRLYNDSECAARFRKVTAPFMMRRMKADKSIISDLPDKIEMDEYAALTSEQAALYEQTLKAAMAEIEGIDTTDHEALFHRQGLILQMILALKQICNHPAQFLKNGDCRTELSGKAELLLDRVEGIVTNGEKVLVFTQFREMGEMLVHFIGERTGQRPMFYHGGCSVKKRQEMVERFQNSRADNVFILSLKAAGTGLNLTAASHVIHYDLWWNPAVEAQATDRAYRIGQQKKVIVHRFITKDTFEERINAMIQQKKHLADMTVASGENWIGKLSNKELREIFG